jgi:HEAT repeat protein
MVADRTAEPGVRIVITSRKASYQGLRGTAEFTEAELQPFSDVDVQAFVRAWGLDADTSLRQALQTPILAGMVRVPLLLTLLCDLAHGTEPLPDTQAAIYGRIIRRFLRSEHRDTPVDHPSDYFAGETIERQQRLLQILRPVAFAFASAAHGWADQMSSEDILDVLRAHPALIPPSQVDAPAALTELSVHAGVLVPAGDARAGAEPPYLFIHRGFAEYLVAEHLRADPHRMQRFIDDNSWIAPEWAHVWVLLGPLLTDPDRVLQRLLTIGAETDPLHLALFAAASLVAEIRPPTRDAVQHHFDEIARRLLALLKTPARHEAAEGLAAISDSAPQEAAHKLLTLIVEPYRDIYVDIPGAGYGVPSDDRADELRELAAARIAAILAVANWPGDDVDEALVQALTDRVVGVRAAAVDVLQQRRGHGATTRLINALRDPDFPRPDLVAEALGPRAGPEVTTALKDALRDDLSELREYAAQALKDRPGDDVTDALVSAFRAETYPLVAEYIAGALQDRPGDQVTDTLLRAVVSAHQPHGVRLTAAWVLRDRPEPVVTQALLAALHNCNDADTRWYLLRALSTRAGQAVTDTLLDALTSGKNRGRGVVASELADRPEPKVTAALREALTNDPDMTVRRGAAQALRDRLDPSVVDALLDALDHDEHPDVRKAAAEALSSHEDAPITDQLINALRDPNPEVAAAAATVLSGRSERRVTDALIDALADQNETAANTAPWHPPVLRCAAAAALAACPDHRVTDALLIAAADHDRSVRRQAVSALQGRRGRAVTTALLNTLSDRELHVRTAAGQALRGRTDPEITQWLHGQADNITVEPYILYAVALYASQLWAAWPRDNREELLRALTRVTATVAPIPARE